MLSKIGIFIFLAFIVFIFLAYARFVDSNVKYKFDTKIVKYEDIRAGDVFLVSFESVSKMFSDSFFRIYFLHPTLVVEEDDEKYVIELMNYGNSKGFHFMQLDEWINRQKHNTILINKLDISSTSSAGSDLEDNFHGLASEDIRKEISKRLISFSQPFSDGEKKIETVGGFDSTWWKYASPEGSYAPQDIENGVTPCNEFCVYLLVKSGIVGENKHVNFFHPDEFIGMEGFEIKKPFSYGEKYLCDLSQYATSS